MRTLVLVPLLIASLMVGARRAAWAVSGMSHLAYPVPEQLRERVEAMVRTLRPHDTAAALAGLRTVRSAASHPGFIILRIEAACRQAQCMTVLARNDAAGMVPELILSVGSALIGSDYGISLWGVSSWGPIHFQGEGGSTISADRREGLWVVGSCAACIEWSASAALPPQEPPPSPSPPPVTESFETFRAAIGR